MRYDPALIQPFRDERLQARIDDSDLIQNAMLEASRAFAGWCAFRRVTT